jgi:outer membrane receptor for ferrienterochelin and colicins
MKRFIGGLCAIAWGFSLAGMAAAAEEPVNPAASQQLDQVVITATMTERDIEKAPGAIEVITRREIEETGAKTLADALEGATGLIVGRNEAGRTKSPNIRGTGKRHSLVLIDGRRMSSGYKDFMDIDQIPLDIVDHIEVVRGAASALYGSDAIGGVVNVITRKTPEKLAAGLTLQGGMHGGQGGGESKIRGSIGDSVGRVGYLIAGSYAGKNGWDGDGRIPDDGDDETLGAAAGRVGFTINERNNLLAGFEYTKKERDGMRFFENKTQERDAVDQNLNYFAQYNANPDALSNLMLRASHAGNDTRIKMSRSVNLTPEEDAKRGLDLFEGRLTRVMFDKHVVTAGLDFRREAIELATGALRNADADNTSAYLQDEYQILEPLYLLVGIRFDNHSDFGSRWTPRTSLVYSLRDNLRIKASYGTGFRAPGLSELHVTTWGKMGKEVFENNPALNPEKSQTYEIGIEGETKRFRGSVTAFKNEITDLIEAVYYKTTGVGPGSVRYSRYQNISEADIQGVEMEGRVTLPAGFSISANAAWLEAENKLTGGKLEDRPDWAGQLKLAYDNKGMGLNSNIRMDYIGERYFNEGVQSGYALLNLYLSKELSRRVKLFGGIDNIFNTRKEKDNVVYVEPTLFYTGVSVAY